MKIRGTGLALAVALSFGCTAQPDDQKILRTLDQSLHDDAGLRDIDATSKKGEVTLSGTVSSEVDRARARDIAEAVEGVVGVRNELTVAAAPAELPAVAAPPPIESTPETAGEPPAGS